jgi:uncharacterized phage-associated protein
MSYSPSAIANTFLRLGRQARQGLDPMQMQKLVYFGHGWHLGLGNGPLITEPIEAWDYGPVVASLYRQLKPYGAGQILEPIRDFVPKPMGGFILTSLEVDDEEETAFLKRILDVYGKRSALELSEITHREETPWSKVRATFPGRRGIIIPDSLMENYFKQLAQTNATRTSRRTSITPQTST